ncbi:HlyD family type I secretion periplasmic adaptor subunit [bacterium AH-315-E07]|nr:HlyD family type I secretion periplasmic adaptor subunit [bacterium AH-315-E07]
MPEMELANVQNSAPGKELEPHNNSLRKNKPNLTAMFDTTREVRLGYWVVVLFVAVVFLLLGTIPLSSAAIAPGVVGVEGYRKVIQHLEGGIVQEILVADGDYVETGQELIKLNDVRDNADYKATKVQLIQALAREARWVAEGHQKDIFDFNQWLLDRKDDPQVTDAMESQMEIHRSRLDLFEEKKSSFLHRQAQASKRLLGNTQRIETLKNRFKLVSYELDEYKKLEKRGLVTRDTLFELKVSKSSLQAELADTRADIAESTALLDEYRSRIAQLSKERKQESVESLDSLRDKIADLKHRFAAIEDRLQRTVITAPISGHIVNLQAHTRGGVIAPGQSILEIVPNSKRLIIEAKVDPKNRDTVKVGHRAEVRFTAFNQSVGVPVKGEVTLISADRLVDEVTNIPYYKTSIELAADQYAALDGEQIHPGMQAEVMILTGKRTVLQYLFSPIAKSFNRALRED